MAEGAVGDLPVTAEPEAACTDHNLPPTLPASEVRALWFTLENRGLRPWAATARLVIGLDGSRVGEVPLPHAVPSGQAVTASWVFRTPSGAGRHELQIEVAEAGAVPGADSAVPLRLAFQVGRSIASRTGRLRDRVLETHARCWLPCDGVSWSSGGDGYPQFGRDARGCRSTDLEGRTYVDYLMGWGSALLGYAHERIRRAVESVLHSAATPTLTPELMPEVADALCAVFPGAEAATFGKNGSDACTAAVRLARAHTGRPLVLSCGYHGWQDWFIEGLGFPATGVPPRDESVLLQFAPGDLEALARLFEKHRGRVAAILLEPAGVLEGTDGPVREVDPAFLAAAAAMARREGALVIFDEILTGFRHRRGSVQRATGITADLTCVGKGLSNGLPLAAVVGRRDVFASAIGRIHYEPTFKGETYALAAAREALRIYGEQDVPGQVEAHGRRLRESVDAACHAAGVPARMIGPPYRMMMVFDGVDPRRRLLMRTLLQQELLRRRVLTNQNLFLPSAAHDEEALTLTLRAFQESLRVVAEAAARDRFASALEIPPLPG